MAFVCDQSPSGVLAAAAVVGDLVAVLVAVYVVYADVPMSLLVLLLLVVRVLVVPLILPNWSPSCYPQQAAVVLSYPLLLLSSSNAYHANMSTGCWAPSLLQAKRPVPVDDAFSCYV